MKRSHTAQTLDVQVFYTSGCANTPPTVALIKTVAAEMGISIRLKETLIEDETPERARTFKILGSPTVQVNGLDIDPAARGNTSFGFT